MGTQCAHSWAHSVRCPFLACAPKDPGKKKPKDDPGKKKP